MDLQEIIAIKAIANNIKKEYDLLLWKSKYLGKNSELYREMEQIKHMSIEDKKTKGKALNEIFKDLTDHFNECLENLKNQNVNLNNLPVYKTIGNYHPVPQAIKFIKKILFFMGYEWKECPEIETKFRVFNGLNVPDNHPAQNDHQSFNLSNGKILRSHTSSLETYILEEQEQPGKFFTIGRTFRRDSDRTHTPMFHQIEIVNSCNDANITSLVNTLQTFFSTFLEYPVDIRLRPSFFPFTEPSYEVDIFYNEQWLEVCGSGILHPNVHKYNKSKLNNITFAAGCGIERLIMIKNKLTDIRELYYT